MKKIWIDTDMGGDIDDAFAISLALHSKDIEVVGISTVYHANQWRTDLAREMLKAYRREDIPVYFGAERPIIGSWGEIGEAKPNDAVQAMIDAVRGDKELILVPIGPLTNIALALMLAPDIAKGLQIYLMGGVLESAHPEWNIECDPEAARIVLESGADITMLGLDVTEKCGISYETAEDMIMGDTGEWRFLQKEYARFKTVMNFSPVLHDPLTVAVLVWDDLVRFEDKDVRVELAGKYTRGATVSPRRDGRKANVHYGVSVNAPEAVKRICARIRYQEK